MTTTKTLVGDTLTVSVEGRLNTATAPELEQELSESLEGVKNLVLDLTGLDYISSAGLRVVLSTQKAVTRSGGSMVIRGVKPQIYDVFEMTGFVDFLTIE